MPRRRCVIILDRAGRGTLCVAELPLQSSQPLLLFSLSTATSGGAEDHAVRIPEIAGHSRGRRECRGTRTAECKASSLILFLFFADHLLSFSSSKLK